MTWHFFLNHFQFQFGLSQTALEMASMDRLLHIPEDSVPCKIRAKRGCATHPRSIAERVNFNFLSYFLNLPFQKEKNGKRKEVIDTIN